VTRVVAVVGVALLAAAPGFAADADIDPDRPDLSSSASTVGAGRLQVEAGIVYGRERRAPRGEDRDRRQDRRFAVETLTRIGLGESLEARVEIEPYVRLRGFDEADDHGDVRLSAKWRILDAPEGAAWPSLALLPFVKLPVAEEPVGSGKTDAGLLVAASFALPRGLGLDVNAGLAAVGQSRPGGHLLQALASASLTREVLARVTAFTEVFYGSRAEWEGTDLVGVDAGLLWKLTRSLALDAAVGVTALGQGPDWFVRSGASVRFGR
jgi:hypothetical protein